MVAGFAYDAATAARLSWRRARLFAAGLLPKDYVAISTAAGSFELIWQRCQSAYLAVRGAARSKTALLFEKRSKNFCNLVRAVRKHPNSYIKKFFGSFFQKRTAFFPALPRLPGITSRWFYSRCRRERLHPAGCRKSRPAQCLRTAPAKYNDAKIGC
jgi:hypothetical protein